MNEKLSMSLLAVVSVLSLAACSNTPEDKSNKAGVIIEGGAQFKESSDSTPMEIEGPQYQQPTMDVLKGKPQLFPAKYAVKRYPNSVVAMVDVRPNRPPGFKNMVMLKTSDDYPKVSYFYEEKLVADGWKKFYQYRNPAYESTKWERGDQEIEIRISPDMRTSDKKYVQLFQGLKPKKRASNLNITDLGAVRATSR